MVHYIDADRPRAEIERRRVQHQQDYISGDITEFHRIVEDDAIVDIIDSLQQEQPEVNLDFQAFAKEMDAVFNLPKEMTENTEENPLNWEYAIARHFFNLGLNARKEENK